MMESLDWKSLIDEIDENKLDLVLGNSGSKPSFFFGGQEYKFSWPTQAVKSKLVREVLSDWAKAIEQMPEGIVKRELTKQLTKDIRSLGISQIIEWLSSGEESIASYMFCCLEGSHKPALRERFVEWLLQDCVDENTNQTFAEFAGLHVARFFVTYIGGHKGKSTALEYLKQLSKSIKNSLTLQENIEGT